MRPRNVALLTGLLLAAASVLVAGAARADVLPVLVDRTDDVPLAWWAGDGAEGLSPVMESLLAESGVFHDIDRGRAALRGVSRILRAPEITLANAATLAEVLGASRVLHGEIVRENVPDVPWLGLRRASFAASVTLADAGTGSVIRSFSTRGVAFGETDDQADAAAARMLARFLAQGVADQRGAGGSVEVPLDAAQPVVLVVSDGTALPFIALRGALRDVHPGVVDVREVWATDGLVALSIACDETVAWDDVARAVTRLAGASMDGLEVRSVQPGPAPHLLVRIATPLVTGEPRP
jgi:hypothetical protein